MVLLITVIVCNFESILLVGTVPTSPLWGFLLGFFLGFSGLASVSFGDVGLKGIFLTLGKASLSMPLFSLIRLFFFSLSSPGSF